MKSVSDVLKVKGTDVWSIGPDASVLEAIKLMTEKQVRALVVLDGKKVVGIISETDYMRKVVLEGRRSEDTQVRTIMTSRVAYAQPDQPINECMIVMTEKRIRHLPVMDDSKLIGMISIGDVVKSIIDDQQYTIGLLERYITG